MVSVLMILGSMALMGGGLGYFTFPLGLTMGLKMMVNLKENGMVFPKYMDPPFGTLSSYMIYAIKNPREVLRGGKMEFEMKGPYYYNTKLVRSNINFERKGEKVRFDAQRKLVLDESKSANLDEKMWLLNPILPGAVGSIRKMVIDRLPFQRISEPIVFNAVNVLLDQYKERLIMRTTPRALLEGRKVYLLEMITGLAGRFGLAALVPPGPPQNIFGLAFVQNETVDPMELWTGVSPMEDKFAMVSRWKGKQKVDAWQGKCSIINGTNGELYKPLIEEGKSIKIFLAPLCRTFHVDPVSEGKVMTGSGILALEYEFTPRLYMGARSNPANRCFCENTRSYECQFDGLITMGPCFFDSPLFFSRGNFKGVDRRIRNTVDNEIMTTNPTSEKQSFYIEPLTGTVLQANLTLMAVFKVVRQPYMRDLAKVQNLTYAPFFSTTEVISVPFEFVWQIYALQMMVDNYKMVMLGTAGSGAGLMLLKTIL